jgi:hypothetical protein
MASQSPAQHAGSALFGSLQILWTQGSQLGSSAAPTVHILCAHVELEPDELELLEDDELDELVLVIASWLASGPASADEPPAPEEPELLLLEDELEVDVEGPVAATHLPTWQTPHVSHAVPSGTGAPAASRHAGVRPSGRTQVPASVPPSEVLPASPVSVPEHPVRKEPRTRAMRAILFVFMVFSVRRAVPASHAATTVHGRTPETRSGAPPHAVQAIPA